MRVTIVGCAGSFPGPDSPASCYLIEHGGAAIVLDLGNGALGALQRHIDLSAVDAVLLSHLHVDHCIDLTSYYVYRRYHPHGVLPRIPVFAPVAASRQLAAAYGMADDSHLRDHFEFVAWSDDGGDSNRHVIGPFTVTTSPAVHPVEAYSIRVETDHHAVVYSGDTAATPRLVDLARGADLALFEASYLDGAPDDGVHLTARQAGEHAAEAGVDTLVLTHLVAWNDRDLSMRQGTAGFGAEVVLATSGLQITLD